MAAVWGCQVCGHSLRKNMKLTHSHRALSPAVFAQSDLPWAQLWGAEPPYAPTGTSKASALKWSFAFSPEGLLHLPSLGL